MRDDTAGLVLAGGLARRMGGGDKVLRPLGGRAMLDHVLASLRPQVAACLLNANGDPARFARFGLPVLPDSVPDWPGPLAGVLAGMDWAAGQGIARIVTAAANTPFFPRDLGTRLAAAKAPVVMATDGGDHPAFAMWDVALRDDLRAALHSGTRRMRDWMDARGALRVEIPGEDPFFNINTPADLDAARRRLAEGPQWT